MNGASYCNQIYAWKCFIFFVIFADTFYCCVQMDLYRGSFIQT